MKIEDLKAELSKRDAEDRNNITSETFDPWVLFPAIYGTYNGIFGDIALEVLIELNGEHDQAHQTVHYIFKEMLCVSGLCEYGTSPRCCWATPEFKEILPEWIRRMKAFQKMYWGED